MSGLEICLVIIGLIFIACSFLFSEHLSSEEARKGASASVNVAAVTEEVVKREVEAEVANIIDDRLNAMEIKIEKMTSEKLMAMGEYSEDIQKRISQNHEEVMFLYNMLNDKETVIKNTVRDIENVKKSVKNMAFENEDAEDTEIRKKVDKVARAVDESNNPEVISDKSSNMNDTDKKIKQKPAAQARKLAETAEAKNEKEKVKKKNKLNNNNDKILGLYSQGKKDVEIAKELGIGIGEVRLVIDLFNSR